MKPVRIMRYEEDPTIIKGLRWLCQRLDRDLPKPKIMYEIGTYAGEAAEVFARYFDEVNCVDCFDFPYESEDHSRYGWAEVEASFDERARLNPNIKKHVGFSLDHAKLVPNGSVDFVYIDADHAYASVKADIVAWYRKIKPKGFIGGHDFTYYQLGVPKAVTEMFPLEISTGKKGIFPPKTIMLYPDTSWLV